MPNGKYILNDLVFEREIEGMGDRKLMEYTARLSYTTAVKCHALENRMNGRLLNKKTTSLLAGSGAIVGAFTAGIVDYFLKRG